MEHQQEDITRNNLLACTTDARKAGLDFRLINPHCNDYADSKINKLIENVFNEYNAWNDDKGTQLIFCDLSTPKQHSQKVSLDNNNTTISKLKKEEEFVNINEAIEQTEEENNKSLDELLAEQAKFDVYTDILKKLVAKGIPQNEIRFIHDAKTDLQKAQLFADMNSGKARILIGSTQKMGAGTNVQKRIVALHHLDCPWRPSDLEQRSGRVIRQGNELFMRDPQNFRVKEFRYATERTYDARMWQVIESKARSIEQFRKAGADVRTLEDITSGAADAAEMKAETTGNPLILLQVQLNSDLRQEEMLYSGYKRQIHNNEESLKNNISRINYLQKNIEIYTTLKSIVNSNTNEHFQGKYYQTQSDNEAIAKDFIIFKDDNSDSNKSKQKEIESIFDRNIETLSKDYQKEYKIFEYKGLLISGEKTSLNTLSFYISTLDGKIFVEPENLVYIQDNQLLSLANEVNFRGFMTKVNNFYNNLDKFISQQNAQIQKLELEITELKSITGDNTPKYIVMEEIEKMSKQKGYKSSFVPKSAKILEDLNKHNKIEVLSR